MPPRGEMTCERLTGAPLDRKIRSRKSRDFPSPAPPGGRSATEGVTTGASPDAAPSSESSLVENVMLGHALTWHGRIDPERHPEAAGVEGEFKLTVACWYDLPHLIQIVNRGVRDPQTRTPPYRELRTRECRSLPVDDPELTLDMVLGPGIETLWVSGPATLRLDLAGSREIGDDETFRWEFDAGDFDWALLDGIHERFRKDLRRSKAAAK